jgi:hypothetical protein
LTANDTTNQASAIAGFFRHGVVKRLLAIPDSLLHQPITHMRGLKWRRRCVPLRLEIMIMRLLTLVVISIAAVATFSGTAAQAREYLFCRKAEAGPGDCKYDTYEQCLAAVSGTNGYCQLNFWLSQPDAELSGRRPPRGSRLYGPGY